MFRVLPPVNDNIQERNLYEGEPECLAHIPKARYLIDKYVSDYWKYDKNDLDYVYMELTLARYFLHPLEDSIWRKLTITWVARALKISPLLLHNDPGLPF